MVYRGCSVFFSPILTPSETREELIEAIVSYGTRFVAYTDGGYRPLLLQHTDL